MPTIPMGLAGHADWQRCYTLAATSVGSRWPARTATVDRWRFEVKRLVLVFNKEKETKGTYRYQEVEVAERDTAVGSLYLKKAVVGDPPPAQLRVTIEANPGAAV
jgi:hypothetical protein